MRLKIENSERSGSDLRLKVGELAERYGETQRELTRLREAAEERQLDATALMEERDGLAEALVVCEGARDELLSRLKSTEEQLPVQLAAHDTRIAELQSQLSRRGEEFSEQLAQLRAEVDAAHSRLRVEEDSAGNLDNYKKRAQIALKKVRLHVLCLFLVNNTHFSILTSGKYFQCQFDVRDPAAAKSS